MRSDIFLEWLNYIDNWFRTIDRKILLLIDNAGSHFNSKIFEDSSEDNINTEEVIAESSHSAQNLKKKAIKKTPNIKLTNIKLIYLPPNTTAHLQPMDAGIIHSFKSKYK